MPPPVPAPFLLSPLLSARRLPHGFGTRRAAPENFPSPLFTLKQIHGVRLVVLDEPLPPETFRFTEADALATRRPGIFLGIRTADCLPLLLAHPASGTVGAVHCGWRSLALGIAGKTVREMERLGGGRADGFLAALGPSIRPCCYAVGEEVREAFAGHPGNKAFRGCPPEKGDVPAFFAKLDFFNFAEKAGTSPSWVLDLPAAARAELLAAGLKPENIEMVGGCTKCQPEFYHSWRGEKTRERMTSFIGL